MQRLPNLALRQKIAYDNVFRNHKLSHQFSTLKKYFLLFFGTQLYFFYRCQSLLNILFGCSRVRSFNAPLVEGAPRSGINVRALGGAQATALPAHSLNCPYLPTFSRFDLDSFPPQILQLPNELFSQTNQSLTKFLFYGPGQCCVDRFKPYTHSKTGQLNIFSEHFYLYIQQLIFVFI